MHDVLKTVNNKNLVVGLEYYVDYRAENHVRADVVIGGYGSGHTKKMLVIELKQWTQVEIINDNNRWTWAFNNRSITNENPGTQCVEYTEKMRNAIIDNNNEHPIVFIPCVYMHNLEKEHITDSREESTIAYSNDDTIMTDEVITDGDKPVKFFLRGSDLSAYIDEVFDEESAIEVFKEYKKRHKTWSIPEIAAILTGNEEQQVRRMEDCLHWDQKKAYEALKTTLKNENRTIDVVYGGPGSGKTLLAMLLLRLNRDGGRRGVFAYKINPSINAFVNEFKRDFMHKNVYYPELNGIIEDGYTVNTVLGRINGYREDANDPRFIPIKNDFINQLNMFKFWTEITNRDELDLIIFDEAQSAKGNEETLTGLIRNGKHIVFFVDPMQAFEGENLLELLNLNHGIELKEHYLWSHFRCHADEGYLTWVEQVLDMDREREYPAIVSPYVRQWNGDLYYKNLDFKPETFIYFDGDDLQATFQSNGVEAPNEIIYVSLWDNEYTIHGDEQEQLRQLKVRVNAFFEQIRREPFNATIRNFGLSEDGDLARIASVRGLEYGRIMVMVGPELYIEEGRLNVRALRTDDRGNAITGEDIKKMYRILMTRSLKECYFLFVDEEVKDYFENFGRPRV